MLALGMEQRRQLAANAHHLDPIVMIGKDGLTENVISELDRSLLKHELIKVKILNGDQDQRASLLEKICFSLNAAPVKQIGKILIIYRINPDKKVSGATTSDTPRSSPKRKLKLRSAQSTKKMCGNNSRK